MTNPNSVDPPKLATWLIDHFSPLLKNEPLAGDLMEVFKGGHSAGWYWRQMFWAILIGLLNLFRKRWGRLAYAVTCGALICIAWFFIFPVTGRYSAHQFSVSFDGHIWYAPVQDVVPSSALPAMSALYARGYGMPWPWSLIYQVFFLTAFQTIVVAFALGAYIGFGRILRARNVLRALKLVVVVLASGNVATTFLGIPPSGIPVSSYFVSRVGWWMLVSTSVMFALLLGMRQTNPGDDSSRAISA